MGKRSNIFSISPSAGHDELNMSYESSDTVLDQITKIIDHL